MGENQQAFWLKWSSIPCLAHYCHLVAPYRTISTSSSFKLANLFNQWYKHVWTSVDIFSTPSLLKYYTQLEYVSNTLSFICFSWSDLVLLTGSLKRPVSSNPMSSHLRVLHSPLSCGLNPEGIYVWGSSAWVEETCLVPPPAAHFT